MAAQIIPDAPRQDPMANMLQLMGVFTQMKNAKLEGQLLQKRLEYEEATKGVRIATLEAERGIAENNRAITGLQRDYLPEREKRAARESDANIAATYAGASASTMQGLNAAQQLEFGQQRFANETMLFGKQMQQADAAIAASDSQVRLNMSQIPVNQAQATAIATDTTQKKDMFPKLMQMRDKELNVMDEQLKAAIEANNHAKAMNPLTRSEQTEKIYAIRQALRQDKERAPHELKFLKAQIQQVTDSTKRMNKLAPKELANLQANTDQILNTLTEQKQTFGARQRAMNFQADTLEFELNKARDLLENDKEMKKFALQMLKNDAERSNIDLSNFRSAMQAGANQYLQQFKAAEYAAHHQILTNKLLSYQIEGQRNSVNDIESKKIAMTLSLMDQNKHLLLPDPVSGVAPMTMAELSEAVRGMVNETFKEFDVKPMQDPNAKVLEGAIGSARGGLEEFFGRMTGAGAGASAGASASKVRGENNNKDKGSDKTKTKAPEPPPHTTTSRSFTSVNAASESFNEAGAWKNKPISEVAPDAHASSRYAEVSSKGDYAVKHYGQTFAFTRPHSFTRHRQEVLGYNFVDAQKRHEVPPDKAAEGWGGVELNAVKSYQIVDQGATPWQQRNFEVFLGDIGNTMNNSKVLPFDQGRAQQMLTEMLKSNPHALTDKHQDTIYALGQKVGWDMDMFEDHMVKLAKELGATYTKPVTAKQKKR
jgi:hypothetical protein